MAAVVFGFHSEKSWKCSNSLNAFLGMDVCSEIEEIQFQVEYQVLNMESMKEFSTSRCLEAKTSDDEARGEGGSWGITPAEPAHNRSEMGDVGHTHLLDQLAERCCGCTTPYAKSA